MREAKVYLHGELIDLDGYFVDEGGKIFDSCGKEVHPYYYDQYLSVNLNVGGKNKILKVHRIVASTFMDICGEYNEVVNHLDENKMNNAASNLRWTTNIGNLTWGNIREAAKKGVENKKKVIDCVFDFCHEVRIPYVVPKIRKTSYGYLAKSDIYTISIFSDFTINWRKSKYQPHEIVLTNI